ncbi:pyrroline-5-carboxylate reductase [Shewanella ulleungensis]|uniref:Pyrroline-5-carboxylate reductase n=1 Tax=Shewanella ulleungensis TaxID=2282699 RepID=A0ABQ2QN02_9GAMM|nr:pyrroline-5-carboxylate reductase [Shewanella ulleungensis]MCL1149880.1 pyrroline-5-carboxylate reductase [Shewanella ulleungensis]GGP85240.1 pyrroline-5-carboxylate reductase [Shewanella ulleungensis]
MTQAKVCFIGAGNMTRSIISGLVKHGYPSALIHATNPSKGKLDALKQDFAIAVSHDNAAAAQAADVIVLSVKPQLMETVCDALSHLDLANKLIITIAAGIPAARYSQYLKQPIKLIRTMPNTPTQIGYGMTGIYAGDDISAEHKAICETLMQSGGKVAWVDSEDGLNQVIALAGSSPAYFFLFIESMIASGVNMGMAEDKARLLAEQAALGAAQMVIQNQQLSVAQLRQNVMSKGGTTARAVETFQQGDLAGLVDKAMSNCVARAEEMAKTF